MRALGQLQRAISSGRLASTWLFAGPQGVGKFRCAIELAKTVMCDSPMKSLNAGRISLLPNDFELMLACGFCESCRAVENRSHPDLHIITKELIRYHDKGGKSKGTTLSIDVIRGEITGDTAQGKEAKIYKRSFRGRGKFFIIDEADLMEVGAQNSLLKTLEEPPAESYLILITTSPGELLSTIRSRAQSVTFHELPTEVVVAGLISAGMGHEDAMLLARLSRGSLGRALRWAEDICKGDEKNANAAARKAKSVTVEIEEDEEEEEGSSNTNKFTPGGILAWTRELGTAMDRMVAGQATASDVGGLIARCAAEYSGLQLVRDSLASADRAKRDGIGLMMAIAAEWFSDRLRHGLGTPHETPLPGITGALDYGLVPELIASARAAESEIDMNANDKILLAATTTRWELLLNQ